MCKQTSLPIPGHQDQPKQDISSLSLVCLLSQNPSGSLLQMRITATSRKGSTPINQEKSSGVLTPNPWKQMVYSAGTWPLSKLAFLLEALVSNILSVILHTFLPTTAAGSSCCPSSLSGVWSKDMVQGVLTSRATQLWDCWGQSPAVSLTVIVPHISSSLPEVSQINLCCHITSQNYKLWGSEETNV